MDSSYNSEAVTPPTLTKEYLTRYSNKIARELKKAGLKYPDADYSDFIIGDERELDREILEQLMT